MPRGPRKRSEAGICHVMLRASNRQRIFHGGGGLPDFYGRAAVVQGSVRIHSVCLVPDAKPPAPASSGQAAVRCPSADAQGRRFPQPDRPPHGNQHGAGEKSGRNIKTKRYVPYVHFGAFLGVLIMQIILIILTVYSVNADAQLLIIGTVLIFEVALDEYAKRKQKIGSPSLGIIPVTFTYNP